MSRRLDTLIKIKRVALREAEQRLRGATAAKAKEQDLATRIVGAGKTLDPAPGSHLAQLLGAKMELAGRVRFAGQSATQRLAEAMRAAHTTEAEYAAARRRLDMLIERKAEARRADAQMRERRATTTKGTR